MSACYSTIACATSAASFDGSATYGRRAGDSADYAFEVMNSLGTIMFAFGGHAVLLEIEVGMLLMTWRCVMPCTGYEFVVVC